MGSDANSILAIPEPLLERIPNVLRDVGIVVEELPVEPRDEPRGFLRSLRCSGNGGVVRISIQRAPHVNPDGPVVVLYSSPDGSREDNRRLMQHIVETLKAEGAWIPVRPRT